MSGRRSFGKMAAIGGLIVAVALLAGMPGATGDELSDLRANNALLQQKLDQIEQAQGDSASVGGADGPANAGAGTAAAGGSFPRSFLIPGSTTSVRIGGNITETFDYRTEDGR